MSNPINFEELFGPMGPGRAELDELVKSVQALSRNTRNLAKNLDTDGQRIGAGLAAIVNQTAALREQTTQVNLLSEQERKGLASLGDQVAKLAQQQQQYQQAQAGQAKLRQAITQADKEAVSQLKVLQKAFRDAYAAGDPAAIFKAAQAIRDYKAQTDQLNKALRGANSEFTAVAGSYNRLSIETQQLGERIRALPGGFDNASVEAQKLKKEFFDNTQRLKEFDRELNQNFREVGAYAKGIIEATTALNKQKNALLEQRQALVRQNNATGLSAEQYAHLRAEIDKTDAELRKVTTDLNQYGVAAKKSGDATGIFAKAGGDLQGTLVASYLSITALLASLEQIFEANAKYSDQLADVRKTTQLSAEATDQLAENLKKVDTRTSLSGLLDIARVGGQLGIAGKDIESFTKSVDVAVQALQDDFKGGAEEIATELGKIGTVFRKELGDDQALNLRLVGSAINELGAEGAATAPYLADVALRTGAVATNVRLGLKDVLAYAATLQETGFNAEVSGTSLNRLFNTLSSRRNEAFAIAKLADSNLTLKEFKRLINTDFQAALSLFLRGLREGGTTTTRFNDLLGTLKLQSGEAKNVITTLAKNVELLTEKQAIAADQLERGTSLAAEAAIKNENLAGSWNKLKNDVSNFFSSGTGSAALKWLVDATRASLNLNQGIGETARRFAQGLGFMKAPVDDLGKSLADNALASRKAADETEHLMARFESLRAVTNPTDVQTAQLRDTVLALKDKLGESAVVLNEQTGQYDLNTVAVTKNYRAQRQGFLDNAVALAKRLQGLEAERSQSFALSEALKEEADRKEALVRANTSLKTGSLSPLDYDVRQRAKTPANYDRNEGAVKPEVLAAYTQYVDLSKQSAAADDKATIAVKKRDEVLRQLERLGLDASSALALLAQSTKDTTAADDKDIDTKKKKTQAVADVLKAQYELRKFELEQQAKDFDRQAQNVANPDEVRIRAIEKAAASRREIARLDEEEAVHEAELKNAKLVNGDKALAVERQLIHAQFLARIKELGLNSDKELLALANTMADQLAQVDKLQLEAELADLDRIVGDENKNYAERQQAALDASARRIEIILLESEIKRRAAKGDAEILKQIQQEEDAARAAALKALRAPDADKANTDLDKQYTTEQLKLEKSLGGKLSSVRTYEQTRYDLETGYLEKRLANLQADEIKQKEAAELELQLEERKNQRKLEKEQEYQRLKAQIVQEGFATLQSFSDAFFQIGGDQRAQELTRIQQSKAEELKVAGNNAALKEKIEKDYAARELAIKRKQAQYDKAQALFNVGLRTAQAVTSVLSTGGGTYFADFGISAGILTALVIAQGVAQAVAIAARPLPEYFKGRDGGPAEFAHLAERGPELAGSEKTGFRLYSKPTVGYLQAGDRVYTAPQTREMLAQNELVEGRLVQRQYARDLDTQTARLRVQHSRVPYAQELAETRAAQQRDTDRIVRAIQEQEQLRVTENGLERWSRRGDSWQRMVNRRYKGQR